MQINYTDTTRGKWEGQLSSVESGDQTPGAARLRKKLKRKIQISTQEEE